MMDQVPKAVLGFLAIPFIFIAVLFSVSKAADFLNLDEIVIVQTTEQHEQQK